MAVVLEARPEVLRAAWAARQRKATASRRKLMLYYDEPVAFIEDCVDFPEGQSLTTYQSEVIAKLPEQEKVAQVGPHGLGKTTTAALLILWFAITRDGAGVDWKCPVTAGAWRQLEQYLWPEIWKWAKLLRWNKIGRDPFKRSELLTLNLNLNHGQAFAVASNVPAYIEGAHADSIFYVFDESKAISDATFDAAEGAFSGAGVGGREAFALASSTPGEPIGRFYDLNMGKPGFEDWYHRHVTLDEAIAAGRINREWAEQRAKQWGAESQLYANRVLGEFHASDEDSVIPLSWIEAANARWEEHRTNVLGPMNRLGADIATSGADKTVFATLHGQRIAQLIEHFHLETPEIEEKLVALGEEHPECVIVIDADGVGAGVYSHVAKDLGKDRVKAFHAGAKTERHDSSGELGFLNTRSAAWWYARESLNPANGSTWELPWHQDLTADLMTPKWKENTRGVIQVESKDDVKKRLNGRSTDFGDAVIMGIFPEKRRKRSRMGNVSDLGPGKAA